MMRSLGSGLLATLILTTPAVSQARPAPSKPRPAANLPSAPSARSNAGTTAPSTGSDLNVYGSCAFPDGLQITEVQPMPSAVSDRPVRTKSGDKTVPLLSGRRVTFAYTGAAPFASVKVEQLPADNWTTNRRLLLEDFDDIVASDKGVTRNAQRGPTLSAFSVVGLDRKAIEGNTLGIYLLLDDRTHVAATVYLLNPPQSKFKTLSEYASARDTFLYNYTRCVRNNQNGKLFGGTQ
jgi:hypothetical protein